MIYGYWQEALSLPRERWLDHINDRFWADRALACQVLRREYDIADGVELPELLFGELRGLWVVAAMVLTAEDDAVPPALAASVVSFVSFLIAVRIGMTAADLEQAGVWRFGP